MITCCSSQALAGEIRVAVASNFSSAIKKIVEEFELSYGHKVNLAFGSTGKHYAQIKNGAPFDVFFAADVERPQRLQEQGVALSGSRFTYAIGKLVLWSPLPKLVDSHGEVLSSSTFTYVAIANPKLAPYGIAAKQIMKSRDIWDSLQKRIVRGENIGQAFQFVKSGSAQLGFISYSQIKVTSQKIKGSYWIPPQSLYEPIKQQAVLLKDNAIAREFLDFVKGEEARMIIQDYGYDTP